jgi:hypothetical protein
VLNKNVSEFCNLTVVFRTPGEKDLKELEERVGRIASKDVVKEVMRLAPGLADGEAFFLSRIPSCASTCPTRCGRSSCRSPGRSTAAPRPASASAGEPKVLAKTDLAAIEERMAAQVQRAQGGGPEAPAPYHEKLKKVLRGPERKLFDAVHARGGRASREELASDSGYAHVRSRGFTDPLYTLHRMGLVELEKGDVVATPLMYPETLTARGAA